MDLQTLLHGLYGTQPEQEDIQPFDQSHQASGIGDDQGLLTADTGFELNDRNNLYGENWEAQIIRKAQNHDTLTPLEKRFISDLTISTILDGLKE